MNNGVRDMRKKTKEVESILFNKNDYTKKDVQSILREKGLETYIDTSRHYYRARQRDPYDFRSNTLRTWHIAPGIKAIVGTLKKGR